MYVGAHKRHNTGIASLSQGDDDGAVEGSVLKPAPCRPSAVTFSHRKAGVLGGERHVGAAFQLRDGSVIGGSSRLLLQRAICPSAVDHHHLRKRIGVTASRVKDGLLLSYV